MHSQQTQVVKSSHHTPQLNAVTGADVRFTEASSSHRHDETTFVTESVLGQGLAMQLSTLWLCAATKLPGAVEGSSGSMLLLATLEDTFQGFYRAQKGNDDSDIISGAPCQSLCCQPAVQQA